METVRALASAQEELAFPTALQAAVLTCEATRFLEVNSVHQQYTSCIQYFSYGTHEMYNPHIYIVKTRKIMIHGRDMSHDRNGLGGTSNSLIFFSSISMTLLMEGRFPGLVCIHHKPTNVISLAISSASVMIA